jgi:hypothetical protein
MPESARGVCDIPLEYASRIPLSPMESAGKRMAAKPVMGRRSGRKEPYMGMVNRS